MRSFFTVALAALLPLVTQSGILREIVFDNIDNILSPQKPARTTDDRYIGNDMLFDCGEQDDVAYFNYLYLTPSTPARGQDIQIDASAYLKQQVPEGRIDVVVKMGVVQILKKSFDLCEEVQKVDWQCPLQQGNVTLVRKVEIPSEVPPGKFFVQAKVFTTDEKPVACLRGTVTIEI